MYLNFAGRGIFTRVVMYQRGLRIGAPLKLNLGYVLLTIWGVMVGTVIIAADVDLPTS